MQEAVTICPRPLQVDFESGVWDTCDVGHLSATFSLPRRLCYRLRPNVRNRQTSDAHHRFAPTLGAGIIKIISCIREYTFPSNAVTWLVGRQEGHLGCKKSFVLVCWWWRFAWSFARLTFWYWPSGLPRLSWKITVKMQRYYMCE